MVTRYDLIANNFLRAIQLAAAVMCWLRVAALAEFRQRWVWHDGAAWQDAPLPVAGLAVDGVRVVGARRPGIAGSAGGATLDMEARSTLNAILGALRETHRQFFLQREKPNAKA